MPTPTPVDDLVTRLRDEASACLSCAQTVDAYTAEELENEASLLVKAADRLEAQAAEIARLREALGKASRLAEIASDWNLYEVEIDGKMVGIYALRDEFDAARLSQPGGEK